MLNGDVVLGTLLIGAEVANPAKMHSHFLRAVCFQRCLFKVLRECGSKGDPAGLMLEEALGPPAESELCERKSTGNLYKAKYLKNMQRNYSESTRVFN